MHTFDHCAHVADYYGTLADQANSRVGEDLIFAKFRENFRNLEAEYFAVSAYSLDGLNAEEVV